MNLVNWGSASEFFAMGGYGWYVWMSYAACAVLMLAEPLLARRRHRRALEEAADGSVRDEA
jgi:heme exporter protein D